MDFFQQVPLVPADPILGLTALFNSDSRPSKVNLGVGLYKADDLSCPIMACVKEAEKELLALETSKEYLPIDGDRQYVAKLGELVFGAQLWTEGHERICGVQTVGGTGALSLGATFIKQELLSSVFISHPTWPNHAGVFRAAGLQVDNYPYYDMGRHELQFDAMLEYLGALKEKSVVLLHASCHNPTGMDLSAQQWNVLAELFKQKGLLAFFDCAYQGFGKGLEEDVRAIRTFVQKGMQIMVAVSNSKNFSLYGERVGAFFVVTPSSEIREKIASRLKQMVRVNYSNPPLHGARIVAHVLSHPHLVKRWEHELTQMRQRIDGMRQQLVQKLASHHVRIELEHLKNSQGMFCYSGLSKQQAERMCQEFGIYMTLDGRINVCGLTRANLDAVASAMFQVMQ